MTSQGHNQTRAHTDSPDQGSDEEIQVQTLGQNEDLVIDGETAFDDLLVAQRIAQQESFLANFAAHDDSIPELPRKACPSKNDVEKLLKLLRQTNKLSKKICGLPSQFDAVVGDEVKNACRAAATAMEKLPLPKMVSGTVGEAGEEEDEEDEEDDAVDDGDEAWDVMEGNVNDALAAVDLHSTSESEAEDLRVEASDKLADTKRHKCLAVQSKAGIDNARGCAAGEEEPERDQGVNEEAEVKKLETMEETKVEECPEDVEPLCIRTHGLPERLQPHNATELVGQIHAVVDGLIVVRGDAGKKVLDLQSVLCLEDKHTLGVVVDVFGPVSDPHYLVHSPKVNEELVKAGVAVYAATDLQETSFLCDGADPEIIRCRLGDAFEDDASEDEYSGSDDDEQCINTFDNAESLLALQNGVNPSSCAGVNKREKGKGHSSDKTGLSHDTDAFQVKPEKLDEIPIKSEMVDEKWDIMNRSPSESPHDQKDQPEGWDVQSNSSNFKRSSNMKRWRLFTRGAKQSHQHEQEKTGDSDPRSIPSPQDLEVHGGRCTKWKPHDVSQNSSREGCSSAPPPPPPRPITNSERSTQSIEQQRPPWERPRKTQHEETCRQTESSRSDVPLRSGTKVSGSVDKDTGNSCESQRYITGSMARTSASWSHAPQKPPRPPQAYMPAWNIAGKGDDVDACRALPTLPHATPTPPPPPPQEHVLPQAPPPPQASTPPQASPRTVNSSGSGRHGQHLTTQDSCHDVPSEPDGGLLPPELKKLMAMGTLDPSPPRGMKRPASPPRAGPVYRCGTPPPPPPPDARPSSSPYS